MIGAERHAGRSVLGERYFSTWAEIYPPSPTVEKEQAFATPKRISFQTNTHETSAIQTHYVRTLPINALKVLEGAWGNFLKEVSPTHPPRPLASPLRVGEAEEGGETVGAVGEVEIGE